jgi:hypothetical protein
MSTLTDMIAEMQALNASMQAVLAELEAIDPAPAEGQAPTTDSDEKESDGAEKGFVPAPHSRTGCSAGGGGSARASSMERTNTLSGEPKSTQHILRS